MMLEGSWSLDLTKYGIDDANAPMVFSDQFKNILGYAPGASDFPDIMQSWLSKIHPEDLPAASQAMAKQMADSSGKSVFDMEYRLKRFWEGHPGPYQPDQHEHCCGKRGYEHDQWNRGSAACGSGRNWPDGRNPVRIRRGDAVQRVQYQVSWAARCKRVQYKYDGIRAEMSGFFQFARHGRALTGESPEYA